MKVFIFDPLWDTLVTPELTEELSRAGLSLIITKTGSIKECKQLFEGQEERLLCLNPDFVNWSLLSDDYKDIPNLKAILTASTAFSWIDTSLASTKNIPVCNIRNFSSEAVAEWAITIMHNLARQVPCLIKDGFPLDFDADFMKYRGIQLKGKTAGIIGLGHIGSAIAERCSGLGMDVVYWSKSQKDSQYTRTELDKLFKTADVIFPTMALNEHTKNIITNPLLDSVKKSAMLVSIVHDMFDQDHVIDKVQNGSLFGFGFEAEPNSFNSFKGNVWAAPAYAWVTDQSMHNSMVAWIDNMIEASKGRYPNKVN